MKVLLPNTTFRAAGVRLAARRPTLRGATIGFLDGWGRRTADGLHGMYPLMEEVWRLLTERAGAARFIWLKKPNISRAAPDAQIAELLANADVVVNGEAA